MKAVLIYSVVIGTVWYLWGWNPVLPTFMAVYLLHQLFLT